LGLRLVVLLPVPAIDRAAGICPAAGRYPCSLWRFQGQATCRRLPGAGGYGAGLVGLVAIKVLAPGVLRQPGYAHAGAHRRSMVLVITQLLNIVLVAHAQACPGWPVDRHRRPESTPAVLLRALLKRGQLSPGPGWGRFSPAGAGCHGLARRLSEMWGCASFPWIGICLARLAARRLNDSDLLGVGSIVFCSALGRGIEAATIWSRVDHALRLALDDGLPLNYKESCC
jgi:putative peptidoglycan lipid II flippase